jgi:para-nitrobenzyl esterase
MENSSKVNMTQRITRTLKTNTLLLTVLCVTTLAPAQPPQKSGNVTDDPRLKQFDKNGDGKIDDSERATIREMMRKRVQKPGAVTPSGKTETVGNREITEMEYASSDGRKIPCVLSMPKGDGPFPCVVTIHGGSGNRDLAYIRTLAAPNPNTPMVTALNEQPWAVLAISYRAGDGAVFGIEQDDVMAGIRFAKSLPKIDAARVGVMGGSHGGHLALIAAEKMGNEFLCVVAGSPWLPDGETLIFPEPTKPPLSLLSPAVREEQIKHGARFVTGLTRGRGLSEADARKFLRGQSIEANAEKIVVPSLFLTSLGDEAVPHVLVQPTFEKLKAAGRDVTVFTVEKSPHGFYWGRDVGGARIGKGAKKETELAEEKAVRAQVIAFFTKQFARKDVKVVASPKPSVSTPKSSPAPSASHAPMTREQFKARLAQSPQLASRPELADRLFDRLDENKDGVLSTEEFAKMKTLRGGEAGARTGAKPAPPPASAPSAKGVALKRTEPLRIDAGELIGEARDGVRVFRGIPYAAAPVGELRWRAPQPPPPWTGVREALEFGAPAFQDEMFFPKSMQSEDCLSLNVWSPSGAKAGAALPVLVWFHGGAFIQGSGAQPRYDGSALAQRGVVVVTVNYRLGPFGLFAHPALTAQTKPGEPVGNFCLLDMMEALRWVRRNIAAFGGDAANVTISGSSAGATSCLFLMGIPEAHGLFHKAIIQSSGGMRNIQDLAKAEAAGARLAEQLHVGSGDVAKGLRAAEASKVSIGTAGIRRLELPVKPIVDGRLVTGTVEELFAQGKQARIPVLIGACNGESGGRGLDDLGTGGAFGFQQQLAADMVRAGQRVHLFQFTFVPPAARATRPAAQHGEAVAYSFGTFGQPVSAQYGFRNEQVAARALQSRKGSRAEGDDSGGDPDASAEGRKVSDAMMDYWVAFLRSGQPSVPNRPEWPALTASSAPVMVFGNAGVSVQRVAAR